MGFASAWLEARALYPKLIQEPPQKDAGIIVVVPAYAERSIGSMLDSLADCEVPPCSVEVIMIVNAPPSATEEYLEINRLIITNTESWKKERKPFFRLFAINIHAETKEWGVGMARKTGMDEALRRFDLIGLPGGIILSLDADCTVAPNYFTGIYNDFLLRKDRQACSIYFEHPLEGVEAEEQEYRFIAMYELHLRYYYQGLRYANVPDVFHTVGSSMAVKALQYMKAGGMNRKQAGEDFYLIQKLIPQGGYFYLNSTTVYPSPRKSFRVPFGTGATMQKLSGSNSELETYNFSSFRDLRMVFDSVHSLFGSSDTEAKAIYERLPPAFQSFISLDKWWGKISEIKRNTSTPASFAKRHASWFNMFMIIKYLNFSHQEFYNKMPVSISAMNLLQNLGYNWHKSDYNDLLNFFRDLERKS